MTKRLPLICTTLLFVISACVPIASTPASMDMEQMAHDSEEMASDGEQMVGDEAGGDAQSAMNHEGMTMPAELDTATERMSENGLFMVSIAPDSAAVPINEMHSWVLHVATMDSTPITTAEISINGGMPEHGHGLPTAPQITENMGDGNYLVEGIRFNMGGWWEVAFTISTDDAEDEVIFNLLLE